MSSPRYSYLNGGTKRAASLPQDKLNQLGAILVDFTRQHEGTPYHLGGKSFDDPGIDCAGMISQLVNEGGSRLGLDTNKVRGSLQFATSEYQIESIGRKAGLQVLSPESDTIRNGNFQSGTIIGIYEGKTPPGWNKRKLGISHIVMFVENDGKKYIAQSASSSLPEGQTPGVHLTPYDDWVKTISKPHYQLYATNPFSLMAPAAARPATRTAMRAPLHRPANPAPDMN